MTNKRESASSRDEGRTRMRDVAAGGDRACAVLVSSLLFPLVLAGCTSSRAPTNTSPRNTSQLGARTSTSIPPPQPAAANVVSVSTCCTATLPAGWAAPKLIANGLSGTANLKGALAAMRQVIGSAHSCPLEPPALLDSLVSPTHSSGDVITAVDAITVSGKRVTVYVTSPSASTPRDYQYANADAVFGGTCVDLGAAEYGVASAFNLRALLQILATTRPVFHPLQP